MSAEISYEERQPPADLADLVSAVWRLRGPRSVAGAQQIQPIVPDGCPEIILNLADPFVQAEGREGWVRQPRFMLAGQLTRSVLVGPSGATDVVGIRLFPWGACRLLGVPMVEVRDVMVPLDALLKQGFEALCERLAEGVDADWTEVVFADLRRRRSALPEFSGLAAAATLECARFAPGDSIRTIARRLSVSPRHLERVMRTEVGLAPGTVRRIARVQRALGAMLSEPDRSLGEVGLSAGYYDQPHFVREFKRLVGYSPSAFLTGEFELTEHFASANAASLTST